jgi:hypothetical protein
MAGPTSARGLAEDFVFGLADAVALLMCLLRLWRLAEGNKKPTAVASRGFLLNFFRSTSANGVGDYNDDYINSL